MKQIWRATMRKEIFNTGSIIASIHICGENLAALVALRAKRASRGVRGRAGPGFISGNSDGRHRWGGSRAMHAAPIAYPRSAGPPPPRCLPVRA